MSTATPERPDDKPSKGDMPGDLTGDLTMEQQFKLKVLKDQVHNLTLEQAQEMVIEVMRQMMVKDNLVKHLLRNA